MARATISTESIHKDLKTCPGGWVELRPLPFYDMLERRDKATKLFMEQAGTNRSADVQRMAIETANGWTKQFEFKSCIIDHNLEDENGKKLDFGNVMTFRVLDPRIGSEIEKYIDELTNDEEELPDFTNAASSSFSTGRRHAVGERLARRARSVHACGGHRRPIRVAVHP